MICGSCQHSHLNKCTNKNSIHHEKNTLFILANAIDCFEERLIFSFDQKRNDEELEKYDFEIACERQETREYYDMTGDGTYVYRIGYLQEQKKNGCHVEQQ